MALPSIEQKGVDLNGVTVQCSHIVCPEPANFRMEDVLEVVSGGYFTWQTVAKASQPRTIVVLVGNVEASFDLTTDWTKFIQVYEAVDPTSNRDVNIFFPAGEYWLYHTMLEKGNRVSDWSASPQDTEEQLAQIYVEIREQYTQIMSDTEQIILQAVSNYVKISDFETFKQENTAAIDVKAEEILSTVSEIYATQETTSSMQSVISQQADQIASKVSQTDYNGNTIASLINQSADSVKIQANHIVLSGDVVLKSNLTDGTTQISGNNIKTGTIDASQVTVINIDASKITTGQIQAGQINVSSISIDSAQIATGVINQARIPELSADKITTGELNGQQVTISHLDASNIDAGTLNASRIAAHSISVGQLTGTIRDDATTPSWTINLDSGYMTVGTITANNIQAGAVTAEKLSTNAVTTDKIATNAVTANEIASNTITANEIAANTITADQIAARTITAEQIATGTISIDRLTAGVKGTLAKSSYSETEYYLSTSSSSATGGSWSTTVPTWASGKYIWTREKTTVTYADDTTSSSYHPQNGYYDKNLTTALSSASSAGTAAGNAQTSANSAVSKQQTIYFAAPSGTSSKTAPSAWVTDTTGGTNKWTTVRPEYSTYYPILFVATQSQTVGGTLACTTPSRDRTTTVIDGGNILTRTVTADQIDATNLQVSAANVSGELTAANISASNIKAGTISAAVTASNLTMTGGNINISTSNDSFDFISLNAESGSNKMTVDMYPLGFDLYSKAGSYVDTAEYRAGGVSLHTSSTDGVFSGYSFVYKDANGNDTARITASTGKATFKDLEVNGTNILSAIPSWSATNESSTNYSLKAKLDKLIKAKVDGSATATDPTYTVYLSQAYKYGELIIINFQISLNKDVSGDSTAAKAKRTFFIDLSGSAFTALRPLSTGMCALSSQTGGSAAMMFDSSTRELRFRFPPLSSETHYYEGLFVYRSANTTALPSLFY